MKKQRIILIVLSALLLSSCFKEEWEGFVYPDKNDLTIHKSIGVYESLESCREASWEMLSRMNSLERGDYECGLNCEYRSNLGGIKVCEKTER